MVEVIGECNDSDELALPCGENTENLRENSFLNISAELTLKNKTITDKFFQKLTELDLVNFEKKLGNGAEGSVFQVDGKGKFSGKKIALKIFNFSQSNVISSDGHQGEISALNFPAHKHLGRAYGVLTYDGRDVHYVEKFNPNIHAGQILLGTVSRAIQGGTLYRKMKERAMNY